MLDFRLVGVCESKLFVYLVMEYCAKGDLHTSLQKVRFYLILSHEDCINSHRLFVQGGLAK